MGSNYEKNGGRKSRDTLPLKQQYQERWVYTVIVECSVMIYVAEPKSIL